MFTGQSLFLPWLADLLFFLAQDSDERQTPVDNVFHYDYVSPCNMLRLGRRPRPRAIHGVARTGDGPDFKGTPSPRTRSATEQTAPFVTPTSGM